MVAVAAPRARPAGSSPTPPTAFKRGRRPNAMWVLIGVPILLLGTLAWQLASSALHTQINVREAVAVGRISLEADPAGSRVDFVLVDSVGQDTTVGGTIVVKVREPDGAVWQTSRSVSDSDFQTLPASSLLAGRRGYSVVVPAGDWVRAPRRGGNSKVTVDVNTSGGSSFSAVSEQLFP